MQKKSFVSGSSGDFRRCTRNAQLPFLPCRRNPKVIRHGVPLELIAAAASTDQVDQGIGAATAEWNPMVDGIALLSTIPASASVAGQNLVTRF